MPLSLEQHHANTQGCRGGQQLRLSGRGKGRARAASLILLSGGGASRSDPPMGRRPCGRRTSSVRRRGDSTRARRHGECGGHDEVISLGGTSAGRGRVSTGYPRPRKRWCRRSGSHLGIFDQNGYRGHGNHGCCEVHRRCGGLFRFGGRGPRHLQQVHVHGIHGRSGTVRFGESLTLACTALAGSTAAA